MDFSNNQSIKATENKTIVLEKRISYLKIVASVSFLGMLALFFFLWVAKDRVSQLIKDKKDSYDTVKIEENNSHSASDYFPKNTNPLFSDNELEIFSRTANDPRGITATAYAAMDRDTGELLISKNHRQRLPIASIVKVMTAMVALEEAGLDLLLTVSEEATKAGEASMGLTAGEKLTVEELLYGIMLPSGNDAAETLARGVFAKDNEDQNRINFIAAMNRKAKKLGINDTFFANPTGLDEETIDKSSYSTAVDLLVLAKYALDNPTFAKIAASKTMVLPEKKDHHKAFYLNNILNFSKSYPGVMGIKPGVTKFASETLLSYAENGNKRIILVILASTATKDDAVKIYDYLFGKLNVEVAN